MSADDVMADAVKAAAEALWAGGRLSRKNREAVRYARLAVAAAAPILLAPVQAEARAEVERLNLTLTQTERDYRRLQAEKAEAEAAERRRIAEGDT